MKHPCSAASALQRQPQRPKKPNKKRKAADTGCAWQHCLPATPQQACHKQLITKRIAHHGCCATSRNKHAQRAGERATSPPYFTAWKCKLALRFGLGRASPPSRLSCELRNRLVPSCKSVKHPSRQLYFMTWYRWEYTQHTVVQGQGGSPLSLTPGAFPRRATASLRERRANRTESKHVQKSEQGWVGGWCKRRMNGVRAKVGVSDTVEQTGRANRCGEGCTARTGAANTHKHEHSPQLTTGPHKPTPHPTQYPRPHPARPSRHCPPHTHHGEVNKRGMRGGGGGKGGVFTP
jgi:hypothetical protein